MNMVADKLFKKPVAGLTPDDRLFIQSPTSGRGSSVVLRQSSAADARQKLFGDAPLSTIGAPGIAAVLQGAARLTRPVDLSQRALITLRVDGGEAHTIDCAGEQAARTFPDEVVARINADYDGLAVVDAQRRLVLTAAQRVELLRSVTSPCSSIRPWRHAALNKGFSNGWSWSVTNHSVRAVPMEWADQPVRVRPRLTNVETRAWIQINEAIPAGFTLHLHVNEAEQVEAWMTSPERGRREVPIGWRRNPDVAVSPSPQRRCCNCRRVNRAGRYRSLRATALTKRSLAASHIATKR